MDMDMALFGFSALQAMPYRRAMRQPSAYLAGITWQLPTKMASAVAVSQSFFCIVSIWYINFANCTVDALQKRFCAGMCSRINKDRINKQGL
jgi:hypothetical protein